MIDVSLIQASIIMMEKSINTVYIAIYNFVNVENFFVKNTKPKTAVIVSLKSLSPYSFKFKKKYK